jgi:glycosyltransferase involved in cell wall biosynthesis
MKVAIVTATHRHPTTPYVGSLSALLLQARDITPELELNYFLRQGHLIDARNKLATKALEWGADWLLFIDDDMGFPPTTLAALLAHDKRVIGCNCATRGHPPLPTACRRRGDKFERVFTMPTDAGIEEVSHIGLGVALIAADALRKLAPPIIQPYPVDDGSGPREDRFLFERLREAGETVWIDHDLSKHIQHWGEFPFTNQVAAQFFSEAHKAATKRAG